METCVNYQILVEKEWRGYFKERSAAEFQLILST